MLYTSRFSNPELKSGEYTAVRISLGTPKWPLGYEVCGAINDLMPYGLFGKYSHEEFVVLYRQRLDKIGASRIQDQLMRFEKLGKPVVLLCYEDVRDPSQTCHRTTFAQWYEEQTGEIIHELPDPSTVKLKAPEKKPVKKEPEPKKEPVNKRMLQRLQDMEFEQLQLSMFT